jgi:tetratricopeptide (TPR) repeat protein
MKKKLSILILIFLIGSFGKVACAQTSSNEIIANFSHLSPQQLSDTANYYFNKNSTDTALICFSLLINTTPKNADIEHQKRIVEAYNRSAAIYYNMADYRTTYDFLIRALSLSEKINYVSYHPKILMNIGNIYSRYQKYDVAKLNYEKALSLTDDSVRILSLLNNLGSIEMELENLEVAIKVFNEAMQISKLQNNAHLCYIETNLALCHQKLKQYDSAFYYSRLALANSRKDNDIHAEAHCLSSLGNLFFEINKIDSALFYIDLSNTIATENNFLKISALNYLTLSEIEQAKGRTKSAFEYFKKHAYLRDSVFNAQNFGEINQLRRSFEVSKTNQQIEELAIEKRIRERTIYWQKIVMIVLLLIICT